MQSLTFDDDRRKEDESLRILWLSVIHAAVQDTQETRPRVRQATIDWSMQDQVDFPRICELVGVDSEHLRQNLASRVGGVPS